jgi:type IV secretory pathway, VirD4 component
MKLKFKAEEKDMMKLLIFSLFLFLTVSIGVGNINSLASENTLIGLNPFPGLIPPLLFTTIGITLIVIVATFVMVEKTFFEREKGFGFEIGAKPTTGYSKWVKESDFKQALKRVDPKARDADVAGIPLIMNKDECYVDNTNFHNLVIGTTGSGKTECVILPMVKLLAKKRESMIITDPKGEIYEKTGRLLKARGYNIVVLNFRNPQRGNCWNPLDLPYELYKSGNKDKATELIDDLAANMLHEEKTDDVFWGNTAGDYFAGLVESLFEDGKKGEININSVAYMDSVGEEKVEGVQALKEYMNSKDKTSSIYGNLSGTVNAPSETKGSIVSMFKQKLKIFTTRENLSEMLSRSDFNMGDIGRKPTAVFIIVHDEKNTYHALTTIFVKQCYEKLIDVAFENGGKLPVRTNFLLDEFANMPQLKDVTSMITAARSRQIRLTFIIQNFAQLNQVYGKEIAETIKGNCGNLVYLLTTELQALEEISKMCGEVKSKKDDKTASTPLVTVSDLQKLKEFDVIVKRHRFDAFKTSLTPNFKMDWGRTFELMDYPVHEKKKLEIFDLKGYVKKLREEKRESVTSSLFKEDQFKRPSFFDKGSNYNNFLNDFDVSKEIAKLEKEEKIKSTLEEKKKEIDEVDSMISKIEEEIELLELEEKNKKANIKPDVKLEKIEVPLKVSPNVNNKENSVDAKKIEKEVNEVLSNEEDDFFDDFFDN